MIWKTSFGEFICNEKEAVNEFLGIPYARANRFEYCSLIDKYPGATDAREHSDSCTQKRTYYEHLEIPERAFYHKEFREGIKFNYSENCLNLNIWTPKNSGSYPVLIFIHGGGFDSGSIEEDPFDGTHLASLGLVVVTIQYRVGIFGYLTHEDIEASQGHDGNFGLDDQFKAITWVKEHIHEFNGDCNNITLMGQSAGAMSIQYLTLSEQTKGLFQRVIMMSGGGKWPDFTLPRSAAKTREYWQEVIELCHCSSFDEFKQLDAKDIFDALEIQKARRKDNALNTMPVIDDYFFKDSIKKLIPHPNKVDTMISFTNCDMFAIILAKMAIQYAKQENGYLYYFDCDAPGDQNKAFHSSDLRYVFGTLATSWRPYGEEDRKVSTLMMKYIKNFCETGNPNSEDLPAWTKRPGYAMHFSKKICKMTRPNLFKVFLNTFKGDPK